MDKSSECKKESGISGDLTGRGICFVRLLEMAKKGGVQSGSYVFGSIEVEMVMYR